MRSLLAIACLSVAFALGAAGSSASVGGVPSFAASKRYAVPCHDGDGCGYSASAVGDLNGDGRTDIVTVNNEDQSLSVFIARTVGGFRARRDYLTAGDPAGAAIADLNGDGHADVAVADAGGFVTVFINRGGGILGGRRDYDPGPGAGPVSIVAADLDGDGSADLVTANGGNADSGDGAPSVSVFRNHGDGTFAAPRIYPISGGNPVSVALGDLNGDGKADIVTGDDYPNLSVLLNNGEGTFEPEVDYGVGGALSVALGDLNGDGKLDVAAVYSGPAREGPPVAVLLNNGDGTLLRRRLYSLVHGSDSCCADPQSIAIADLNGDRRPDLATGDGFGQLSLLLNRGAGVFHSPINLGAQKCGDVFESDRALAVGDLNGDRRADLAVAGDKALCVSVARPGLCNVQDVRGLRIKGARALLARAHCRVGAIRRLRSNRCLPDLVSAQRPGFGSAPPEGAKVDLVLCLRAG